MKKNPIIVVTGFISGKLYDTKNGELRRCVNCKSCQPDHERQQAFCENPKAKKHFNVGKNQSIVADSEEQGNYLGEYCPAYKFLSAFTMKPTG